jgi:hypothetical protein
MARKRTKDRAKKAGGRPKASKRRTEKGTAKKGGKAPAKSRMRAKAPAAASSSTIDLLRAWSSSRYSMR